MGDFDISNRPDRPLIVKCTFDRWNKRITFSSSRNCTYDLLRGKIEQCFSLSASSYVVSYKDDDGEVTDITNDNDLTEAIHYFRSDDPPLSSASSILSGRSFGNRKITLRVHITVDYDGPSLSDTSSLASMDEYKRNSNGSDFSLSFSADAVPVQSVPEDDSVTISSRDTKSLAPHAGPSGTEDDPFHDVHAEENSMAEQEEDHAESATSRYPEDPSAVFDRLKLRETIERISEPDQTLSQTERGAAWLRDQNARSIKAMLGTLPEPSESDSDGNTDSLSFNASDFAEAEAMDGDLSLTRDPRGKYYYSYTSSSSSSADARERTHDSAYDDTGLSVVYEPDTPSRVERERFNSSGPGQGQLPVAHTFHSEPLYRDSAGIDPSIPPEVLQYLPTAITAPPMDLITDCSACGVLLDSIRYVCAMCGEKEPGSGWRSRLTLDKGKGKTKEIQAPEYPPHRPRHLGAKTKPSTSAASSRTYVADDDHPLISFNGGNAPPLPGKYNHGRSHSSSSASSGSSQTLGFELCAGCLESAGVHHALDSVTTFSPGVSSSSRRSPEHVSLSQWQRSAPRHKGAIRHVYVEKAWGPQGWEDVEQDDCRDCRCSTCNTLVVSNRYKCASCQNFSLCKACYSQVHEVHPSHAFLLVPDKPYERSHSDTDIAKVLQLSTENGEPSLTHPGVKCAHCMQDIVGARFHCAVCESIDICSNCESAGLPGNLESADGGHNSSHIMIKIPYPLATDEVQVASRRAVHLWTGRDAANVGCKPARPRAGSLVSSYARTVIASRSKDSDAPHVNPDRHIPCNGCGKSIIGVRYQCATCRSSPFPFSLCSDCELRSYILHDPMHVFFKFPRPLDRPLESKVGLLPVLYKSPVGYVRRPKNSLGSDPKAYLKAVLHTATICDRCMSRIQGEWFRCAYCDKDLCDACEAVDTHNNRHVFMVFKSTVNMQILRRVAQLDNPNGIPPVIPYPVYDS